MNNEKISIGVPVYNMEDSIKDTINSILESTYDNIEIIVVNDSSTDKTSAILDEFIDHPKIKVINHEKI